MKFLISFLVVLIGTVCLAAVQSEAKKGCNAYGYACYGGHGKRSLRTDLMATGLDHDDLPQEAVLQLSPSEANILFDGDLAAYPRYRLIKMMKSWFGRPHQRPAGIEYPIVDDVFTRDTSNNNINNNNNDNDNNRYK